MGNKIIKTFEGFFSKKKKLSMENIIEYIKKYFNNNKFDTKNVSTLKNNINKVTMLDDSLEVLLDNLLECSELKKSIDEYLDEYLKLYNQYLHDEDWHQQVEDYAIDGDEGDWYYYKPLAKFIKKVC